MRNTDCLQMLHKLCKNWISVPNIVHQLILSLHCIIGKYKTAVIPKML